MCNFPSWIEQDDSTVLFLTDSDVESHGLAWSDAVGHSGGVRKAYPGAGGVDKEGFPCPPVIAEAIMGGRMQKMMAASSEGYASIHVQTDGQLHRVDGPAITYADGREWYLHGKLHRVDGPAVTYADGCEHWYLNGKLHRVDGPAVTYADGREEWWLHGERHPAPEPGEKGKVV